MRREVGRDAIPDALRDLDTHEGRLGPANVEAREGGRFARLDVDGDEFVLVCRCQVGANLALDQRVSAAGELFFAVAAIGCGDELPLIRTVAFLREALG